MDSRTIRKMLGDENVNLEKAKVAVTLETLKNQYLERSSKLKDTLKFSNPINKLYHISPNKLNNVLITGATGFLGIHIVNEIIKNTKAHVYCLIRAENEKQAQERLHGLLEEYFKGSTLALNDSEYERIKSLPIKDLANPDMGLSKNDYDQLVKARPEVIYNCAANVTHYGERDKLLKDNVTSLQEIIKFAEQTNAYLVHTSTLSVSGAGAEGDNAILTQTEFDEGNI
jgi:thioester reductase-like protein